MSRHRRGRITVQNQPTGAGRFMMRGMGVVHAIFGGVFAFVALTVIMPQAGIIGLPFLAALTRARMPSFSGPMAHTLTRSPRRSIMGR